MSDERLPIATVLRGMEVHALPEGWTPVEALCVVKCLDAEGHVQWSYRTTHRLNREELLGALVVHTEVLRHELVSEWLHDEGE
jgi:hypothetical protein